jgi:hypothetical protein
MNNVISSKESFSELTDSTLKSKSPNKSFYNGAPLKTKNQIRWRIVKPWFSAH